MSETSDKTSVLVLPLWPNGPSNSLTWSHPETQEILPNGLPVVRNISQPTLTVFLPDLALSNGLGVVVCPGGAYHFVAHEHEGIQVARWLNARGIAAFMLKYRLHPTGDDFPECVGKNLNDPATMAEIEHSVYPMMMEDGFQALRLVREHAVEWGVNPGRVGIMGFSAGGLLTTLVAKHYAPDCRPDFVAPIYPAPAPDAPVPADAPPLFALTAGDDNMAVPVSIKLYSDWRTAGRSAELHIYSTGGHGFGMKPANLPADSWIERLGDWLGAIASTK